MQTLTLLYDFFSDGYVMSMLILFALAIYVICLHVHYLKQSLKDKE